MFDYNIHHEAGRSAEDLDAWTEDIDEARQIAVAYFDKTGIVPAITRYPMRETVDGYETDPTTFERVV